MKASKTIVIVGVGVAAAVIGGMVALSIYNNNSCKRRRRKNISKTVKEES
jgi:hypothetical protein